MVLVLAETEKFQPLFPTASIERLVIFARTFMNEPKLRQNFSVELFRRFHVCHPQIDVIKATRFHFVILNRVAREIQSRVIVKVGRACLRADGNSGRALASRGISMTRRTDMRDRYLYSPRNRAKIGSSFCIVASGHNFRSVTNAVSNAECSGQLDSMGIRGITSAMILRAVSEFASK